MPFTTFWHGKCNIINRKGERLFAPTLTMPKRKQLQEEVKQEGAKKNNKITPINLCNLWLQSV
ncbi:MAG: hypothetical protein A2Z50_03500 [Nitrospirae bacterium RBG_19FT_COMBO_42_15]|nr:MAG: hypothetical protein A2Z50_03500 [Nitrospirae bacterium RBG_19FT_COMBO_42_15]